MKPKWLLGRLDRSKNDYEAEVALDDMQSYLYREEGYVYLMYMEGTPCYKIGKSIDPERRLREMASVEMPIGVQWPMTITLIHSIATDLMSALEYDLHEYFIDRYVNGEWYKLSDADVGYIKAFGPCNYYYADLVRKELDKRGWSHP